MASLYAEIEIGAPKQLVWKVLTTKEKWHHWNTFLYDCDPSLPMQPGQEIFVAIRRLPEEEETELEPVVTMMQPHICLKWVSSIPGLKTEYVFELQEIGFKRTKYVHKSNFSGLLTNVVMPFIRQDELRGIRRMSRELKHYIERRIY